MKIAGKVVGFVYAHLLLVGLALAALFTLGLWAAVGTPMKTDVFDLLPFRDAQLDDYKRASQWFGGSDTLYFNVSGRDARACAQSLAQVLSEAGFETADYPDAAQAAGEIARAYPLLYDGSFDLSAATSESAVRARFEYYKKKMSGVGGGIFRKMLFGDVLGCVPDVVGRLRDFSTMGAMPDGAVLADSKGENFLLIARHAGNAADSDFAARVCALADGAITRAKSKFPEAQIDYIGAYAMSADNAQIARADSSRCLPITCALILAVCVSAFRNRVFALAAAVPTLIGTVAAFCVLRCAFSQVSALSVAFASIAAGVGIDYALHILYPLDSRGKFSVLKAQKTADSLSSPIFAICFTTLTAFAIIACLGGAMAQLGLFGFVSVALTAAVSVFVLPAFAAALLRARARPTFFERIADKALLLQFARPRVFAAAACLLALASLPLALRVGFDGAVSSLASKSERLEQSDSRVRAAWGAAVSSPQIVAYGRTFDEAATELAAACARAEKLGGTEISRTAKLLQSSAAAEKNLEKWEAFWTPEKLREFSETVSKVARENGINPAAFKPALDAIRNARSSAVALSDSPQMSKIFAKRIFRDSQTCALCVPISVESGADLGKLADAVAGGRYGAGARTAAGVASSGGDATDTVQVGQSGAFLLDMQYLQTHISQTTRSIFLKCVLVSLAAVGIYLSFALRSVLAAAGVMFCVAVGLVWSFALMEITGTKITLTNSVFVIFSVCLAQDYAVMIFYGAVKNANARAAGGPVLLSAITTIAAFGTLALARHTVIAGLGVAAAVSVFSILCASLCIAPFLAVSFGGKSGDGK